MLVEPQYDWPTMDRMLVKHFIKAPRGPSVIGMVETHDKNHNGTTGYLIISNIAGETKVLHQSSPPRGEGCGTHPWKGFRGFEDPRLFKFGARWYIVTSACAEGSRRMFLHDIAEDKTSALWVKNLEFNKVEKNWTPFVNKHKIFFVYSFGEDETHGVLELLSIETGECRVVYSKLYYSKDMKYLGSTQLIQWAYPIFVGFAHTRGRFVDRDFRTSNHTTFNRVYRSVPMTLNVESMELKFGNPITFHSDHDLAKPWIQPGLSSLRRDIQFP